MLANAGGFWRPESVRMKTYRELVQEAQSADLRQRNDAFDQLARDFQGMVYGVAYSRLSNAQLAEDAAQDAFLTAFKQIEQLQDVSAFPAWLKRIALSKAERILRRQGPHVVAIDGQEDLASSEPTPESQFEAAELRQRVGLAVAALPLKERELTQDYYLHGESQREISERRKIPLATVKKRLQYAREHLRGLISGFNESFDRAIYQEPQREFQPVYIRRQRVKIDDR